MTNRTSHYEQHRARQYEQAKIQKANAPTARAHADELKAAILKTGDERHAALRTLADKHETRIGHSNRAKPIREAVALLERNPLDQNAAAILQHQHELLEAAARHCEQVNPEQYAPVPQRNLGPIGQRVRPSYEQVEREQVSASINQAAPLTADDRRRIQDETREITAAATGTTV
ncbi:hypothetical protein [Paraburkholderia tropica]|uniref:hypothetical protein n=1 Tax=Paraburkholderia tropica TaxID=92647 RepID=UPI002AAFF594|nr:hypothetical protein [Paraburkholderia tropica]